MRAAVQWWIALLATLAFTLATVLAPTAQSRSEMRGDAGFLKAMMGDGRRLFANHFFTKADVYFHSGYYPSIFDQVEQGGSRAIEGGSNEHDHSGHAHDENGRCVHDGHGQSHEEHEEHSHDEHGHCEGHDHGHEAEPGMDFVKAPRDWMENFGRRFSITEHTHLESGQEAEMLPWLRIAAQLDPQMTGTYTTAAYWLRRDTNHVNEAREFLLEGLRNNPGSHEILLELGRLYFENLGETNRARNVWVAALRRWNELPLQSRTNDMVLKDGREIVGSLARLEEGAGRLDAAIYYFEITQRLSPNPESLDERLKELRAKRSGKLR